MIIINNDAYILDPKEVSIVRAGVTEILITMKGSPSCSSIPTKNPNEDARRLVEMINVDIKAGGDYVAVFNTESPDF